VLSRRQRVEPQDRVFKRSGHDAQASGGLAGREAASTFARTATPEARTSRASQSEL